MTLPGTLYNGPDWIALGLYIETDGTRVVREFIYFFEEDLFKSDWSYSDAFYDIIVP